MWGGCLCRFRWQVTKATTQTSHVTPDLRIKGRLVKLKSPDATQRPARRWKRSDARVVAFVVIRQIKMSVSFSRLFRDNRVWLLEKIECTKRNWEAAEKWAMPHNTAIPAGSSDVVPTGHTIVHTWVWVIIIVHKFLQSLTKIGQFFTCHVWTEPDRHAASTSLLLLRSVGHRSELHIEPFKWNTNMRHRLLHHRLKNPPTPTFSELRKKALSNDQPWCRHSSQNCPLRIAHALDIPCHMV